MSPSPSAVPLTAHRPPPVARPFNLPAGKYSKEKLPEGPRGILFGSLLTEVEPLLGLMRRVRHRLRHTGL